MHHWTAVAGTDKAALQHWQNVTCTAAANTFPYLFLRKMSRSRQHINSFCSIVGGSHISVHKIWSLAETFSPCFGRETQMFHYIQQPLSHPCPWHISHFHSSANTKPGLSFIVCARQSVSPLTRSHSHFLYQHKNEQTCFHLRDIHEKL